MSPIDVTPLSKGPDHSFFAWRNVHVLVIGTDITPSLVETAYECGREFERRFAGPHGVLIDYHGSIRVPPFAVRTVVAEVARKAVDHDVVARAVVIRGSGFLGNALRSFVTAAAGIGRRYPQKFCVDVPAATEFLGNEMGGLEPRRALTARIEAEQRRLGLRID